jgi:hypothetical protein
MKSVISLATIFLLIFACRICSFTGSKSTPQASSSPRSVSYPSDLTRQQLGPFRLMHAYNKQELRKTASGFTLTLIDQSTDAAGGEYKSSDIQSVALMATSYPTTTLPAALVDQIETGLRADTAWKTVKAIPTQNGKRVEGVDGQGNSLVIWNSGYWVFLTVGSNPSAASSLADNVGY